ncbi:PIN domain-containing protein [Actinosynnema sp. CS-041913]|uniref:PIN domain-containing protein n=1 Tax=Actinosynnema sp. CS-041913 TaxID=3239917 RepID=UPI003D8E7A24
MRDVFHGYFPPTDDEYKELLKSAIIVLDTNALLNLYRYTQKSREELLSALTSLSDRMWMPHHVGVEFHRRRIDLIRAQLRFGEDISSAFNEIAKTVDSQLGKHAKNAFIDTKSMVSEVKASIAAVAERVQKLVQSRIGEYGVQVNSDPLLDRIASLYAGKVGVELTPEEWAEIRLEGEDRYSREVPPGYLDRNKSGDQRYGDLVIWRQLLKEAKNSGSNVIFVTDDIKDDWWWKADGKIIGPRPELRSEFRQYTDRNFYAYRAEHFVEILKENQSLGVSAEAVREVRETSRRMEDAERIQVAIQVLEEEIYETEEEMIKARASEAAARARMTALNDALANGPQVSLENNLQELRVIEHDIARLTNLLDAILRQNKGVEGPHHDTFDRVKTGQKVIETRGALEQLIMRRDELMQGIGRLRTDEQSDVRQRALVEKQAVTASAAAERAVERYLRLKHKLDDLRGRDVTDHVDG